MSMAKCESATSADELLSEKLRTSRYSDDVIQKMQDMEQAEIEKAYELGRMEQEACEGCINRHEAIIQLSHNKTGDDDVDVVIQKDIETIKALPLVTPGSTSCDVAVSRQAAIDAVNVGNLNPGIVQALQSILAELPPVTPQPKMGKWINGNRICPCCGEDKFKDLDADIWADWQPKHCPNCGAKMEGAEE